MLNAESSFPTYADLSGSPLQSGSIYYGAPGLNPVTNPVTVYWDAAGTQPVKQPVKTVNGMPSNNGTPARVWISGDFSRLVLDALGRTVLYEPTVQFQNFSTNAGAGLVGFSQSTVYPPGTLGAKAKDMVSVRDDPYNAKADGVTNDGPAFKAAAASGKQVRVPGGTYKVVIGSAADTALFAPGTCFIADGVVTINVFGPSVAPYFPAWAIVNQVGTQIVGKFKFVQNGNFTNTGAGTADPYATGHAYEWYVFSSHIFVHNLQKGRIDNLEFAGATAANVSNLGLYHAFCQDTEFTNFKGRDLASVMLTGSGDAITMRNIAGDFLNADAAIAAYGPGHIIYCFVQSGLIENIWDGGNDTGAGNTGHSLSLKSGNGGLVVRNVQSKRATGPLNYQDCIDMVVDGINWIDNGVAYTDTNSPFYGSAGSGTSTRNDFRNVRLYSTRDRVMFGGFGSNFSRYDIAVTRASATSANPISDLRNAFNHIRLRFIDKGTVQSVIFKPSDASFLDNLVDLDYVGPFAPLNDFSLGGARNRINFNPKISNTGRRNVMQPAAAALNSSDATVLLTTALTQQPVQLMQETTLAAGAAIAATFNLPGHGVWLASLTVISADRNHARTGLYQVVCDDAGINDFTIVALIGAELTKGNNRYLSLTVSVTNGGALTVSTTDSQAPTETHTVEAGFVQLASLV